MKLGRTGPIAGVVGLGLLTFGAACAPSPPPPPAAPRALPAAPAAAAQPKPGGAIRVAPSQSGANLEPYAAGRYDMGIGPAYDRLVEFRNDEKARFGDMAFHDKDERGLAERWEYTGPTTLVMNLKRGVKWHDGQPFTAEDVAWSVNWAKNPENRVPRGGAIVTVVDKVEAPDPYTVRFITKQPAAALLNRLTEFYIVPKHIFDRGENLKNQVVGTGPFKLKEYVQNQKIVLERFPDYHWKGRPYVDRYEATLGLDESTQVAAFAAQKTDAVTLTDKPQYDAVKRSNPDVKVTKFIENVNITLRSRLEGPLADVRVRKAVHLAIDRHELVDAVTFGEGKIPPFGLPHQEGRGTWTLPEKDYINDPGFRKEKAADLQEAKRLLAEAGYATGFKWVIKGNKDTGTSEKIVPVLVEQVRRDLGLDVEYQGLTPALFDTAEREGNYQTVIRPSQGSWGDPQSFADFFYGKSPQSTTLVKDAEFDRMFEEQQGEFDPAKRVALIRKMQQYLGTTYYSIPLVNHAHYYVFHPWVNGLGYPQKANPDLDTQNLIGVWLNENAPGRQ